MMGSKSVFLCAALTAVALLAVMGTALSEDAATYVSNKQCKICHNSKEMGEIWNAWKAEKHAKAFETLNSDAAKEIAKKEKLDTPPAESPRCLGCHVTAFDATKGAAPDTIAKEDGIQCESCHGPASMHTADGKKFKTTKDPSIKILEHIVKPDAKVCAKCHNEKSPTWKGSFDFAESWKKIEHKNPNKQAK